MLHRTNLLNINYDLVCSNIKVFKGLISVAVIVIGAFIAGARDLSFDAYGYGVVLMANLTTAVYLATIARIGEKFSAHVFF